MKKDLSPKYLSRGSYDRKIPIPVGLEIDPRFTSLTSPFKIMRQNADPNLIGNNKSLGAFLLSLKNSSVLFTFQTPDQGGGGQGTPDPRQNPKTKYDTVTNLAASFNSAQELVITWDFDTTANDNDFATDFSIKFVVGAIPYYYKYETINKTSTSQSFTLTKILNSYIFGPYKRSFTTISVAAEDNFGNIGDYATIPGPPVPTGLTAPTITVTALQNGYTVNVTNISSQPSDLLDYISIEEYISDATTEPTGVTYTQVSLQKSTVNPVNIFTSTTAKRWVKARFTNNYGEYSDYSAAVAVTPTPVVVVDNIPPNEVTSVTGVWSGNNIVINYTLPATDPGVRFIAQLTAPNSSVAYFYIYPVGSGTSQTATITRNDLYNQFGDLYSSFNGVLKSVDAADNRSSGVSFSVATRANPLVGVTPTPTITAVSNGYSASWTLPAGATYAEVYQKATTWGAITSPVDYYTATASSGTSGTNTIVVNAVKDNNNNSISTIPTGYFIAGTGIPNNTFVSAVSGTSTLTLTLSTYDSSGNVIASNLNATASGSYTITSLVYSGIGPATIPMPIYGNIYVVVRYYDDWHNYSNISAEAIVKPINPAVVDNSVPNAPSITSTSQGNNTITINIATTDVTTKGYRIRYKKSTDTLYTTDIVAPISTFSAGTSTTSYTINNLTSGTTYNISGAGYNQYNGVGSYSTDINVSTATPTVSVITGLTLTASTYGFTASWTAPASPTTPVSQYKVELYNSSNTLLLTDYTFSTNYSVAGLTASTTYYLKVYTVDVYNKLSAAVQSSNITLNAIGQTTDGLAPAASPSLATGVTALYGALEVKWTGLTIGARSTTANPDPVTYEVHVSTTSGFTPAAGTKALETSGTFAIIKTLPGTQTALSYGTTYYVKIIAKDFDGPAAAGTQGSASPLYVSDTDLTANTINANKIVSGSITATQIDATNLLVGKLFAVGTTTDTYAIKIDATANTVKLYGGTGTYQNSNTGFYLDTTGKFSIRDRLWIDGSTATTTANTTTSGSTAAGSYTVVVASATGITTGMYVTIAAGIPSPTLVTGVNGTTITLSQRTTAIINSGTSISFTSSPTLTVNGIINAQSGVFNGAVSVGDMKLGAAVNGTNNGIYLNSNNYWYDSGNFSIGGSSDRVTWDGTNFNVTGGITAQRGSIAGPLLFGSNGYILLGTSATVSTVSGDGTYLTYTTSAAHGFTAGKKVSVTGVMPGTFNLDKATIFDTPTTTTFRVANTSTGTYQYGGIAMMTDYGNRMQIDKNTITAYDATGTTFTTQIVGDGSQTYTFFTSKASIGSWIVDSSKLYSGSGSSYVGLSTSGTYAFFAGATDNTGTSGKFTVTAAGAVQASNMQISGGSLNVGAAAPNGFHVDTSGNLTAGNATLSGAITATSGSIQGNFQVVSGAFYAGSLTGARVAISSAGLSAFDAGGTQTTSISSTASGGAPTFTTSAAQIGNWKVDSSSLQNSAGTFKINSTGDITIIDAATPTYQVKLSAAGNSVGSTVIFSAGNYGQTPNFSLTQDGTLTAKNVDLTGKITATSGYIGNSTNGWQLNAGSITSIGTGGSITGGTFQTSSSTSARRIVISDSNTSYINFYPSSTDQTYDNSIPPVLRNITLPGYVAMGSGLGYSGNIGMRMAPPTGSGWVTPFIDATAAPAVSEITLTASAIQMVGQVYFRSVAIGVVGYDAGSNAFRNISAGTLAPSGGSTGDVYIQY